MPMQDIHLIIHKPVNKLLDLTDRQVMSRGIDHQASPCVVGLIVDQDRAIADCVMAFGGAFEELRESFEASDETWVIVCDQFPTLVLSYCQLIPLMFDQLGCHNPNILHNNIHNNLRAIAFPSLLLIQFKNIH